MDSSSSTYTDVFLVTAAGLKACTGAFPAARRLSRAHVFATRHGLEFKVDRCSDDSGQTRFIRVVSGSISPGDARRPRHNCCRVKLSVDPRSHRLDLERRTGQPRLPVSFDRDSSRRRVVSTPLPRIAIQWSTCRFSDSARKSVKPRSRRPELDPSVRDEYLRMWDVAATARDPQSE